MTSPASYEVALHSLKRARTLAEIDDAIKATAAAFVRERIQIRED